ncbi:MAG: tetraacyldisaccharide 4'-kinase [Dysgonamonadaceae bacterium]|jgi:tetraacyldisaccharide 4'-kinase|nr:tetraacyldisaccharide 4'-kinase [Dysgonamonadaceae bacterium]
MKFFNYTQSGEFIGEMYRNFKIYKSLTPLSWLYGSIIFLRNKLFDWKILPSESFDIPVISIGNLATGGTGKTPHTEFLIRLLSKKYKVAVLSRGYRRKTKGFILADENATAQTIGDEPFQMHRKFPEIIVAVDANRRRAIRLLLEKQPDVILLDDAFQHRFLKPSLSILLTDKNRPFWEDKLLPAGQLREPASNYKRADILIVTKNSGQLRITNYDNIFNFQFSIFNSKFIYRGLLPVFPEFSTVKKENIEHLKKESYSFLAVTGLANPKPLTEYLKNYSTDLKSITYPDHHDFTKYDISNIEKQFQTIENQHKIVITSEKDAVRLQDNPFLTDKIKPHIYYLPIEVAFCSEKEEHSFILKIENHVKEFTRNRILA